MDILGSIMKKMEKPPQMDEKERKMRQQQKEAQQKAQEEKERRVKAFREQMTKRLDDFSSDETQLRLVFEPMEKLSRAILHDISDTAGLLAHSFGDEEVDRHVIVFKPEGMPSEPELIALRRGEEYNPEWECQRDDYDYPDNGGGVGGRSDDDNPHKNNLSSPIVTRRGHRKKEMPQYMQKYEKQLGGITAVAKDGAKSTQVHNKNYGFVNSEQKKDKRTIEETLADIRKRKKQKTEEAQDIEEL